MFFYLFSLTFLISLVDGRIIAIALPREAVLNRTIDLQPVIARFRPSTSQPDELFQSFKPRGMVSLTEAVVSQPPKSKSHTSALQPSRLIQASAFQSDTAYNFFTLHPEKTIHRLPFQSAKQTKLESQPSDRIQSYVWQPQEIDIPLAFRPENVVHPYIILPSEDVQHFQTHTINLPLFSQQKIGAQPFATKLSGKIQTFQTQKEVRSLPLQTDELIQPLALQPDWKRGLSVDTKPSKTVQSFILQPQEVIRSVALQPAKVPVVDFPPPSTPQLKLDMYQSRQFSNLQKQSNVYRRVKNKNYRTDVDHLQGTKSAKEYREIPLNGKLNQSMRQNYLNTIFVPQKSSPKRLGLVPRLDSLPAKLPFFKDEEKLQEIQSSNELFKKRTIAKSNEEDLSGLESQQPFNKVQKETELKAGTQKKSSSSFHPIFYILTIGILSLIILILLITPVCKSMLDFRNIRRRPDQGAGLKTAQNKSYPAIKYLSKDSFSNDLESEKVTKVSFGQVSSSSKDSKSDSSTRLKKQKLFVKSTSSATDASSIPPMSTGRSISSSSMILNSSATATTSEQWPTRASNGTENVEVLTSLYTSSLTENIMTSSSMPPSNANSNSSHASSTETYSMKIPPPPPPPPPPPSSSLPSPLSSDSTASSTDKYKKHDRLPTFNKDKRVMSLPLASAYKEPNEEIVNSSKKMKSCGEIPLSESCYYNNFLEDDASQNGKMAPSISVSHTQNGTVRISEENDVEICAHSSGLTHHSSLPCKTVYSGNLYRSTSEIPETTTRRSFSDNPPHLRTNFPLVSPVSFHPSLENFKKCSAARLKAQSSLLQDLDSSREAILSGLVETAPHTHGWRRSSTNIQSTVSDTLIRAAELPCEICSQRLIKVSSHGLFPRGPLSPYDFPDPTQDISPDGEEQPTYPGPDSDLIQPSHGKKDDSFSRKSAKNIQDMEWYEKEDVDLRYQHPSADVKKTDYYHELRQELRPSFSSDYDVSNEVEKYESLQKLVRNQPVVEQYTDSSHSDLVNFYFNLNQIGVSESYSNFCISGKWEPTELQSMKKLDNDVMSLVEVIDVYTRELE